MRECAGPDRHVVPGTRRCECVAFLDVDRRTCVPRCDQWRYFGTERRCELWCPTEFPIVSDTDECTTCAAIDPQKPYCVRGRNDCYANCASTSTHKFRLSGGVECFQACPESAPYYLDGECFRACPFPSYRRIGRYACEGILDPATARHSVSFAGESFGYFFRLAASYTRMDLGVWGRAAAFLEAGPYLTCLRLRAVAEDGFSPAVFFRTRILQESELWLMAKSPSNSALLGVFVCGKQILLRCALGAEFREDGEYRVTLRGETTALIMDCAVNIGREIWYYKSVEVAGFWYSA